MCGTNMLDQIIKECQEEEKIYNKIKKELQNKKGFTDNRIVQFLFTAYQTYMDEHLTKNEIYQHLIIQHKIIKEQLQK